MIQFPHIGGKNFILNENLFLVLCVFKNKLKIKKNSLNNSKLIISHISFQRAKIGNDPSFHANLSDFEPSFECNCLIKKSIHVKRVTFPIQILMRGSPAETRGNKKSTTISNNQKQNIQLQGKQKTI